jgi:hypothetical protein
MMAEEHQVTQFEAEMHYHYQMQMAQAKMVPIAVQAVVALVSMHCPFLLLVRENLAPASVVIAHCLAQQAVVGATSAQKTLALAQQQTDLVFFPAIR